MYGIRSVTRLWFCAAVALILAAWAGCGFEITTASLPDRVPTRPDATSQNDPQPTPQPTPEPEVLTDADLTAGEDACLALADPVGFQQGEMFDLVNEYRRQNGLDRLVYSRTLQEAADDFAERMYVVYGPEYLEHTEPDGTGPSDRAVAAGFCHPYVGENIARGLNLLVTAEEAMQGFIDSPDHNENMLQPLWTYTGMGFYRANSAEGDHYRWVQLFAQDVDGY